jgi:UDP-glucose:(heptosyl)LPS alpha-1,3-glucosyltransferase
MKLAFCLFKYFPFGGLQRDLLAIAKECLKNGHEIHIYCQQWRGDKPAGFHIHLINSPGITNHQRALNFSNCLNRRLKKQGFDKAIGFNRMRGLDLYFAADSSLTRQKKYQKFWKKFTRRFRVFLALEKAVFQPTSKTKILCLTERQKEQYQKAHKTQEDRFSILPPNLPAETKPTEHTIKLSKTVRSDLNIKPDDFMLISVASALKTKGVDRSIIALSQLPEKKRACSHLVVIGKKPGSSLLAQVKKLKLSQQVHFVGQKESPMPYLLAADLFIHPARKEAGGIVLLEAIVAGLPIITTSICGYAAIVKKSKAGKVLPPPFDQMKLDGALEKILSRKVLNIYKKNIQAFSNTLEEGQATRYAAHLIQS